MANLIQNGTFQNAQLHPWTFRNSNPSFKFILDPDSTTGGFCIELTPEGQSIWLEQIIPMTGPGKFEFEAKRVAQSGEPAEFLLGVSHTNSNGGGGLDFEQRTVASEWERFSISVTESDYPIISGYVMVDVYDMSKEDSERAMKKIGVITPVLFRNFSFEQDDS
ncbi:carbohydrate binding domain-containing protein [Pseudomonas quasicaspiana]|uniref:hypothetical protein n=1 Tax=Pseudomonas quasicaspiana TaxID=2829821 RepID=UPI001E5A52CB|nr:hypothetical protein [Pseudomonas quasicaspiana]MCD5979496.1 hypothetical protein [Pseudomonas quasicaspiana]